CGEEADALAAECLRPLGIPYDLEIAALYRHLYTALLPLRSNLAMLLDEGQSQAEARAYARRWLLEDDAYVDKIVTSFSSRGWRPYESCYPEGLAVCRRFVDGDRTRFRRLLEE